MASESSRFQHLLQPIRDLSKNWNIDLAQELEEYLDELEHLSIAFDDDGVSPAAMRAANSSSSINSSSSTNNVQLMNFAEAALLIQGTSMIYSRKVEYLHALVFQTLSHLSKQQDDRYGAYASANGAGGDDEDGASDEGGDDTAAAADGTNATAKRRRRQRGGADTDAFSNPLPIFDELEEAKNITLKRPALQATASSSLQTRENNLQASIALMGSLVPDERDHGDTFKLLSCLLHPSGVLLMDEASKKYLAAAATPSHPNNSQHVTVATPLTKLRFDPMDTSLVSEDNDGTAMEDDAGGFEFDGGGYDDDAPAPPEEQDGDGDQAAEDIFSTTTLTAEPVANEAATRTDTPPATTERRGRATPDTKDPWALLDPYDASKSTVRPFRKGRSYPARGLLSQQKKKAKKSKTKEGEDEEVEVDGLDNPAFKQKLLARANRPQWSTWVWSELDGDALETKFKKTYCKAPSLATSFPALWQLETKWRGLLRRSRATQEQSAQAVLLQEQADEEPQYTTGVGLDAAFVGQAATADQEEGDDEDDNGYDDNGLDTYEGEEEQGAQWSMALLDGAATLKPRGEKGSSATVLSYEEICRQHVAEFMKGTEQYLRETDLTRQVSEWQDALSPILKEQDAHPPFDIQLYGREILGHLKATTATPAKPQTQQKQPATEEEDASRVPFGAIVGGRSQYEVCRLFLASLQLANNGNVRLSHAHTAADQSKVPFEMALLSTDDAYAGLH